MSDPPGGVNPTVQDWPKLVPVTTRGVPSKATVLGSARVTAGAVALTKVPPVETAELHVTTTGYTPAANAGVTQVNTVLDTKVGDAHVEDPTVIVHPEDEKPVPVTEMGLPERDTARGAVEPLIETVVNTPVLALVATAVIVVELLATELHVTTTEEDPAVRAGVVQATDVVLETVFPVQSTPPTETTQPVAKLVPVTVKVCPEAVEGSDVGDTLVIVGASTVMNRVPDPAIGTPAEVVMTSAQVPTGSADVVNEALVVLATVRVGAVPHRLTSIPAVNPVPVMVTAVAVGLMVLGVTALTEVSPVALAARDTEEIEGVINPHVGYR